MTSDRPTWLAVFGTWTVLGLLESVKTYYWLAARGLPRSWLWVSLANMPWWYAWAVLTPAAFWIAARWSLSGRHRPLAIAIHGVAACGFAAAHIVLAGLVTHWLARGRGAPTIEARISGYFTNYFIVDLVIYAAIVGACFALDYARRWRESTLAAAQLETRAARLELGLAAARLQALRMELNPHFLFNTLNAISGLVRRQDTDAAVGMLARLGDLLRVTLDRDLPQEIALDDELALLQRYLDIEQARFGARLAVRVDVDPSVGDALVPTLLCQPLVENAVRHGVARRSGPVAVTVRAGREGTMLAVEVHDTGRGLGSAPVREGIGLSNTRARLRELYGDAATVQLQNAPGGGTTTVVRLPFRQAPNAARVAASA